VNVFGDEWDDPYPTPDGWKSHVLSGRPSLRTPDGERELEPGEVAQG